LRKNSVSLLPVLGTGFIGVVIQCVFVRELLTISSGNEILLGIIFSLWLLASGFGSFMGSRLTHWSTDLYVIPVIVFITSGFLSIRYVRVLFDPGVVIPAFFLVLTMGVVIIPVAFLIGYCFGILSNTSANLRSAYRLENMGALGGAGVILCGSVFNLPTVSFVLLSLIMVSCFMFFLLREKTKTRVLLDCSVVVIAGAISLFLYLFDSKTVQWKYSGTISAIRYTPEGELVWLTKGADTTVVLNNALYRSTLDMATIEQAVHIPVSLVSSLKDVLVIFDRGSIRELGKYPDISIDNIETMPFLATPKSIITSPELYCPSKKYGCILLGSSLPGNTSSGRFFTVSFFRHVQSMLSNDGIFSFTLPFNLTYMQVDERRMYDVLRNTLAVVFKRVLVFPGDGYATFLASEGPLRIPASVRAPAKYLSGYILPFVTQDRIASANKAPSIHDINTTQRPLALYNALKSWMRLYGYSSSFFIITLCILFAGILFMVPKSRSSLSIGTSGFAIGIYSIALMILYQATHGNLYMEIASLLMALYAGFVLGALIKKIPCPDLLLGIYIGCSFFLLLSLDHPGIFFFMICHAGIGVLGAAQFVMQKKTTAAVAYATDLFGGVFGMALASTVFIPLFGILPVMAGLCILKCGIGLFYRFFMKAG
jgi:predicted membrane-bound spermidine synthase